MTRSYIERHETRVGAIDFGKVGLPEGHGLYVLTEAEGAPRTVAVLALTSTVPGEGSSVQGMAYQGEDPFLSHADAIQALSDHVGIAFPAHGEAPTP